MLRHLLQIKKQVIAPFPSTTKKEARCLEDSFGCLQVAYSSLGGTAMVLVGIQDAIFDWELDGERVQQQVQPAV